MKSPWWPTERGPLGGPSEGGGPELDDLKHLVRHPDWRKFEALVEGRYGMRMRELRGLREEGNARVVNGQLDELEWFLNLRELVLQKEEGDGG